MKRIIFPFFFLLLCFQFMMGQWPAPPLPVVDTLQYTITDTVYMSPTGVDTNDGELQTPVKSFEKAMSLLPYDTIHNYGLIIFLSGDYYPSEEMIQDPINWQNISNPVTRYKNISVQGQGNAVIHGDSLINPNQGAGLLVLKGSHIFIKDITLKNCGGNGLGFALGREVRYANLAEIEQEHAKNILVDNVTISGATEHGILAKYVDTVLIQNCEVFETSRDYQAGNQNNWGGGIRFDFSSNVTSRNNYVHHNYGEGINLGLTYNSIAYDNKLHDNRGSHIYCQNSRKAVVRNNLTYTTVFDSTFWTPTHRAATGVSIRNEFEWAGSVKRGYWLGNSFCEYWYLVGNIVGNSTRRFTLTGCSGPNLLIPVETDSIRVFNNIMLNAGWGFAINDNNTRLMDSPSGERSIFKNIDIHHNTCYGWSGDSTSPFRMVSIVQNADAPLIGPVSIAENIHIHDNIFLLPEQDTTYINHFLATHPDQFQFTHNVWNGNPENGNYDGDTTTFGTALVIDYFPNSVTPDSLDDLNPSFQYDLKLNSQLQPAYLLRDHNYLSRVAPTNLGALEFQDLTIGFEHEELWGNEVNQARIWAYPNPAQDEITVSAEEKLEEWVLINSLGQIYYPLSHQASSPNSIRLDLTGLPSGIYLLSGRCNGKKSSLRIRVQ